MKAWGQPTKGRSNDSSVIKTELVSLFTEETVQRTEELLNSQGWCLWKCSALDSEVIAVVRDELIEGVPQGMPVYTELELEELCEGDISEATLQLIHEAKKVAGAKVISKVTT